jgi:elongation factor Ts
MSTISAADVMKLRSRTNAPMMDCKSALEQASGDMDKAAQIIREKNAKIQIAKADREAAEGRVAVFVDPAKGVAGILEMRCESAPVAKNDAFIQMANDLAKHIALTDNPAANVESLLAQPYIGDAKRTVKDRVGDVVGLIRENMKPARFVKLSGGQFGTYIHHDGSVGVLLQVEGTSKADAQMLKDICMHITAKQPTAALREEVDQAVVAKEREIAKAQAAASGKPANIAEKIAEGKLRTWFAENVLVEQPFVKDESKTIGDLLKAAGLTVKRFVRFKVGEISK